MAMKRLIFLTGVPALTVWVLLSGIGGTKPVRQGSPGPDFTLADKEGHRVSLSSFRGDVVFVNFWRTDCPPCEAEMPDMELLSRLFKGRRFQMMPISLDADFKTVEQFYLKYGFTMPLYWDPGQNVASRYNTLGTPETFLIGPDGTVLKYFAGQRNWMSPEMLTMLDSLIPASS